MVTKDRIDDIIFAPDKFVSSDRSNIGELLASITAPMICKLPSSFLEEVLNTIEQFPGIANNSTGDL